VSTRSARPRVLSKDLLPRIAAAACVCFLAALPACGESPGVATIRLGEGDLLTGPPGEGPLDLATLRAWLDDPANHRELRPILPVGLDEGAIDVRGLGDNPLTRAKVELGRQLYFDPRLSRDGTVSCASCHDPEYGYAFPAQYAIGVDAQEGRRNSPTAANRLLSDAQFWDGRADSLEAQAIGPMANPTEMGSSHTAVVDLLRRVAGYRLQFERVFGDGVTIENAGRALASFERALVSGPSPWDRHKRLAAFEAQLGDDPESLYPEERERYEQLKLAAAAQPLPAAAERGAELFFGDRTGCTLCHAGATFSDEAYHNLGVGLEALADLRAGEPVPDDVAASIDWGRFDVTGDEADRGAFKTPTLRNVAQTAPYLHDGSLATLEEVVALYVRGGEANPWLSPLLEPLDLTEAEQADLVAFLRALTGDWPEVETGRLPD